MTNEKKLLDYYSSKQLKPHWEKYEKTCDLAWKRFCKATQKYWDKYQKEIDKAYERQNK